jgi:hypothetical protein
MLAGQSFTVIAKQLVESMADTHGSLMSAQSRDEVVAVTWYLAAGG